MGPECAYGPASGLSRTDAPLQPTCRGIPSNEFVHGTVPALPHTGAGEALRESCGVEDAVATLTLFEVGELTFVALRVLRRIEGPSTALTENHVGRGAQIALCEARRVVSASPT